MGMGKYSIVGFALVAIFYLWLRPEEETPPPAIKPAETVPQGSPEPPPPVAINSLKNAGTRRKEPESANRIEAAPIDNPKPKNPPPGLLEFEIKEGLAVMQGDVVLGKPDASQNIENGVTQSKRTRLWESNRIPYSIQEGVTQRDLIFAAIDVFKQNSPVEFVPYAGEKDSLVFVKSNELCASYLGRVGGAQPIYLAASCGINEIVHELMHALGFVHEHSRPDRDKYLEVLWQNIDPKFWLQFWIMPDDLVHDYVGSVFSFDGESIMLYDPNAFAKSAGLLTLKSRSGSPINPSRGRLSRTDQERLMYLYGR